MKVYVLLVVISVSIAQGMMTSSINEYSLFRDLFSDYSNVVRPVANSSAAVIVQYDAALQQIIDMDEKNQILTTSIWIRMFWTDDNFTWNPDEYGGSFALIVPSDIIWKPDIMLYNSCDENFSGKMNTNAQIKYDGTVSWLVPVIYKSTCKIDVTYFPFDEQRCNMTFGSWAYHGLLIDIVNRSESGDIDSYMDNGEWNLVAMPVTRNVVYYGCCAEPYPDVTFTVIVQRRSLFYLFNLLLPCILVSGLTLLDFYLPADAGEKVTLGITILLALMVFMLIVAEAMPPTSEVIPLIGRYYGGTIALVSMSTIMTVIVLSIHYKIPGSVRRVPKWARVFFLNYCARMLCMGNLNATYVAMGESSSINVENNHLQTTPSATSPEPFHKIENVDNVEYSRFEGHIVRILRCLETLVDRQNDQDKDDVILKEWKLLATVIDRIFMWVFLLATVSLTTGTLLQAPAFV
ncbi:neuronal acetylcholine receptor subunit alpha-10-like [Saccoglossus kowalevskii]